MNKLEQCCQSLSVQLAELTKLSALPVESTGDLARGTEGLWVQQRVDQIIKDIQDLLLLTRTLRERWLLDQIPTVEHVSWDNELPKLLDDAMEVLLDVHHKPYN